MFTPYILDFKLELQFMLFNGHYMSVPCIIPTGITIKRHNIYSTFYALNILYCHSSQFGELVFN